MPSPKNRLRDFSDLGPADPIPPVRASPFSKIRRPLATVDVAIFTIKDDLLQVLLLLRPTGTGDPYPGKWAMPGGLLNLARDATLEACAKRKLLEKTGVATPYLEQVGTWGSAYRDPRGWSVATVYFALMPLDQVSTADGSQKQAWYPVDQVPDGLAFDHDELLAAALARLRSKVEYTVLPASLLPAEFTMSELQRAFEAVLGRELDKSAFRTRMLSAGAIEETGGEPRRDSRRPATVYRLAGEPSQTLSATFRRRD